MQASFRIDVSRPRALLLFLALLAALVLAASAGYLLRETGASGSAATSTIATQALPKSPAHDDSYVIDKRPVPHDDSWAN